MARNQGTTTPIRLVSSAKSWLCHPDVDRKSAILPAGAPDEIPRISPFDATVHYLAHLRDAWNGQFPYDQLSRQEVTVTVPASFDPAARELTAEAARAIGIEHLVLLEEPQAALYSWVNDTKGAWRHEVQVGDIILVVDVGGGTTDLSLIAVTEQDGALELTRVAVGEHILLGGDNMDLTLAHLLETEAGEDRRRAGSLAAAGPHARLPSRQGITAGRCRSGEHAGRGPEPRLASDRRQHPHRADPRGGPFDPDRGFLPGGRAPTAARPAARAAR
jgi:molecular chaperone DnaK (HSP70)